MTGNLAFLVNRQDFGQTTWHRSEQTRLDAGHLRLALRRFAFTSNNITYARCGDAFGYWDYFPAAAPWGSIPVWGIGEIVQSRHADLAEGEMIYGYFPMSRCLDVKPDRLKTTGFVDAVAHRVNLPRTYNEYVRIDHDSAYDVSVTDAHLVLRPLFSLAFFLAHFLADAAFYGARTAVISSASSKTAMALAFELRRVAGPDLLIVGLTSVTNKALVEDAQLYDRVFAYSESAALPELGSALYIDIAGQDDVRADVHRRLGDLLCYSCKVGLTHPSSGFSANQILPGPKPEIFFTPTHILARRESWGPDRLRERLAIEWQAFLGQIHDWFVFEHGKGQKFIEDVYAQVLHGRRPANRADILSFEPA